jgi:prepilin signal peptidase PulO-like enzyme (type II secretory pathway)
MLTLIAHRLSDAAKARIRTLWPYLIGVIATWLVAKVRPAGLHVDSITAGAIVSWVLGTIVYEGGRWLASRRGRGRPAAVARWAGRWMVSLGLPIQSPSYPTPAQPQPGQGQPAPATGPAPQKASQPA